MGKPSRFLWLLSLRATYDSLGWARRHVYVQLGVFAMSALVGLFSAGRVSVETALASAFIGIAATFLLWGCVWLFYLIRAPEKLRNRSAKKACSTILATAVARIHGRNTRLADRARRLLEPIAEFEKIREMHFGRGGACDENVRNKHREVLDSIEYFGNFAASASLEDETSRGRKEALRMYEAIRGFPVTADLEQIAHRIYDYTAPPASFWTRLRYRMEDEIARLWGQVN